MDKRNGRSEGDASLVDLRLLKAFLTVSESGNMTQAAHALGLTQSAVSQSIKQLEEDLQVTLVLREHRPLQLTMAGLALKPRAAQLIEDANSLPRIVQELGQGKLSQIRIGLADSFAVTVGPQLIKDLLNSTYQLSVWSGLSTSHSEAFLQRTLDLVASSDPLDDIDGLDRNVLLREPFMLIVPADLAGDFKDLALEQLAARLPMIRYSARSHIGPQIDRYLRRLRIHAPRTVEVDGSDALVAMVGAGLGWAMTTPLCLLQGRAHAANVKAIKLPSPAMRRAIILISRTGEYAELPRRVAAHARRILKSLEQKEIRKLVPWLNEGLVP